MERGQQRSLFRIASGLPMQALFSRTASETAFSRWTGRIDDFPGLLGERRGEMSSVLPIELFDTVAIMIQDHIAAQLETHRQFLGSDGEGMWQHHELLHVLPAANVLQGRGDSLFQEVIHRRI